ncbi:hypothetical protein BC829DRAFT_446750 [Chytridium lagenaria]|nr:hypothetical protein BC829DRAFT_446750 [Chytridium lagenaria]
MATLADRYPFLTFANFLDSIQRERAIKTKRTKIVLATTFSPALRLLVPHLDKDRATYGIKDKMLATLYIEILSIPEYIGCGESCELETTGEWKSVGDFGRCFTVLLRTVLLVGWGMTVGSVNEKLGLLNACDNTFAMGVTETTVFNAWHPEAEDMFNVSSSLSKVARELNDLSKTFASKSSYLTLNHRYKLLERILTPRENFLQILEYQESKTTLDVIQDPTSPYLLNERGDSWLKLKPDYIDSLGDDVDLLLVGGFFGTGRRSGKLSHFMCALKVEEEGGLTRYIEEVSHEGEGHWRRFDPKRPPSWFEHPVGSKERPDMILAPEHSRVVCVKAAEIVRSEQYAAGWTLRFPRFVRIRHDKRVDDVMSVVDLQTYILRNNGRMQSRRLGVDGGEKEWWGGVVKESEVLEGVEVCVVPGAVEEKHGLEQLVVRMGGTRHRALLLESNDRFGDSYTENVTIESLKECFDSIDYPTRKRKSESDFEVRLKAVKLVSEVEERVFGMAPILGSLFRRMVFYMDGGGVILATPSMRVPIEHETYSSLDTLSVRIRCCGGVVTRVLSPDVTHIVVETDGDVVGTGKRVKLGWRERRAVFLRFLVNYPDRHERRPHVVTTAWVKRSVEQQSVQPDEQ